MSIRIFSIKHGKIHKHVRLAVTIISLCGHVNMVSFLFFLENKNIFENWHAKMASLNLVIGVVPILLST